MQNMQKKQQKVFIDGSAGTTGLRIADRMAGRDDVCLLVAGEAERKDTAKRAELINAADVVFLCLPDDAARQAVSLCENPDTRIIDASTAHRTAEGWAYGFAELSPAHKKAIETSKRVAVPGCHAGGFCAVVYPLIASGLLAADTPLSCFSLTGYSGGGKKMIASYEAEQRAETLSSPAIYGLSQNHKHLPEMTKICGLSQSPIFLPTVSDFYSGMAVTVPLFGGQFAEKITPAQLAEFYGGYYADGFVSALPYSENGSESGFIYSNSMSGSDAMKILVCGNAERFTVSALFDNLGKGASGAAIQCFNLMTGAEITAGLNVNI